MRISERDVSNFRSSDWHKLASLTSSTFRDAGLPDALYSDSEDCFPELGNGSGEIVGLLAFTSPFPVLATGIDWIAVRHQAGGLACHQVHFVGINLTFKAGIAEGFREIARRRHNANGGRFYSTGLGVSDIVEYSNTLKSLELSCERSFRLLEEGVYPVDATQTHLNLMFSDAPRRSDIVDACDYGNLTILVLAENSD